MSVITPNPAARTWQTSRTEARVPVYLSDPATGAGDLVGARAAGFALDVRMADCAHPIAPEDIADSAAAVLQVDRDNAQSIARFEQLAARSDVPLIASAWDPGLAFVRALVRAGAHDVIPLPLDLGELETALAPIRDEARRKDAAPSAALGKVVSIIKSGGGIGASTILAQLGVLLAQQEAGKGREACLIDCDVQFGDLAFLLGLRTGFSIRDLVDAGKRLDPDLLRSTAAVHSSGLRVIASPPDVLPLDSVTSDQLLAIVDLAAREYATVLLDLPANWTNWSLSLLARSDLVLMFVDLSVPSLARAKRQLDLIAEQGLDGLNIRIVVNRFEKKMMRAIGPADVRKALGHDIAYTIADDPDVVRAATDRGVPVAEVQRRSALGRDLAALEAGLAGALGRER